MQSPASSLSVNQSIPKGAIPFIQSIIPSNIQASKCDPPLCAACQFAKAKRRSANGNFRSTNQQFSLRSNHLSPGLCISVYQYESPVRGRIPLSKGGETCGNKYVGGTIFYDHSSGYIQCMPQFSLLATDTIISNAFLKGRQNCVESRSHHITGIMGYSNQ